MGPMIGKQLKEGQVLLKLPKKKQLMLVIKRQRKKDVKFSQEEKKLFGIQILFQVFIMH